MTTVGRSHRTARVSAGRLLLYGALAGVLAAVVNAVLYLVAAAFVEVPVDVTLGGVLVSSFVPALLAAVFLAVLWRFTRRAVGIFRVVAVVLLVLSLATPFSLPGISAAMIVVLLLMHVVAAVAVLWALTVLAPRRG